MSSDSEQGSLAAAVLGERATSGAAFTRASKESMRLRRAPPGPGAPCPGSSLPHFSSRRELVLAVDMVLQVTTRTLGTAVGERGVDSSPR